MWVSGWLLGWAMMKRRKIPNSNLEIHFCPPPGREPPSSFRTAIAFVHNSARKKKSLSFISKIPSLVNDDLDIFLDILLCKKISFLWYFYLFPALLHTGHQFGINLAFLQQQTYSLGEKCPLHKAFRLLPLDRHCFDVPPSGRASPVPFLLTFLLF